MIRPRGYSFIELVCDAPEKIAEEIAWREGIGMGCDEALDDLVDTLIEEAQQGGSQ